MTTIALVLAAIVSALQADLGTVDLSGADAVKQGTFTRPPGSTAFAAVLPATLTGSEPQCRATWYLETYKVVVRLWAPFTSSTTDDRVARGRLLAAEAQVALDNARALGSTQLWRCTRYAVTGIDPDPVGAVGLAGWAHSTLTLTLSFRRLAGTGT